MLNAPDDLYYKVTKKIETVRQDIELVKLKKLARAPFKTLKEYQNQYTTISKIWISSIAANATAAAATAGASTANGLDLTKTTKVDDVEMTDASSQNSATAPPPATTPPPTSAAANGEIVVLD